MNAQPSESQRKHLPVEEELAFIEAYGKRVVHNPWWPSACEQNDSSRGLLRRGIKERAIREACEEFRIPLEEGFRVAKKYSP
jgi:hypothetical protein